jgi:alkaline phosphatase
MRRVPLYVVGLVLAVAALVLVSAFAGVSFEGDTHDGQGKVTRYLSLDAQRGPGDVPLRGSRLPASARPGAYVQLTCTRGVCTASRNRVVVKGPVAAPTLLAAGDIAHCDSSGDERTAAIAAAFRGNVEVATLGDSVYETGTAREFARCYAPSWGRVKARTRPAAGNHDYGTGAADAYYAYFGPAAGVPGRGWYSYEFGGWHVIVLNSNCAYVPGGGCAKGSEQERWLKADLAAHPARCTLAYWHHPRWSSGLHGSDDSYDAFWRDLQAAGADVVLTGHDHHYERFAPQTADAKPSRNGIRDWVVGTGGSETYPILGSADNSQVRIGGAPGVFELTLRPNGYEWRFIPVATNARTDSGQASCH